MILAGVGDMLKVVGTRDEVLFERLLLINGCRRATERHLSWMQ